MTRFNSFSRDNDELVDLITEQNHSIKQYSKPIEVNLKQDPEDTITLSAAAQEVLDQIG